MIRASRIKIVSLFIVVCFLIGAQLAGTSPALAATIDKISVTCKWVSLRGKTEVRAPYVRVQAVLGSDLTQVLATQVVPTRKYIGASYRALLDISWAGLPDGTLVVVAAGEWDGTQYLKPATITSRNCNGGGFTPTPPPFTITPTFPPVTPSATPTFIASPTITRTPILPPPTILPTRTPITPFPTFTPPPITRTPLPPPTFTPPPITRTPPPTPTVTRTPIVPSPTFPPVTWTPTPTSFGPTLPPTPTPVWPTPPPTPTPFMPTPPPTYTPSPISPPATPTLPPY